LGPVEAEVVGEVAGAAQLLDDPAQVGGQHRHLLLLDLDRRLGQALPAVEEEEPVAHLADDADGAVVGLVVVGLVDHDSTNSLREPVEFMHITAGPPPVKSRAETEQGEMTSRCTRSSGMPAVAATIALIGSACETATMVSPGWTFTSSRTAVRLRVDISVKDSPPGKRKPLGQRCTVGHSLVLYSRARDF